MNESTLVAVLAEIGGVQKDIGKVVGTAEAQQRIIESQRKVFERMAATHNEILSSVGELSGRIEQLAVRVDHRDRMAEKPDVKVDAGVTIQGSVGGHVGKGNAGDLR